MFEFFGKKKYQSVGVSLPFHLGSATWEADPARQLAAWELFVEVKTRLSSQLTGPSDGTIRDALDALRGLFAASRDVLKKAGAGVGTGDKDLGGLTIQILDRNVRPFLNYWEPRLSFWESKRPAETMATEHEQDWPEGPQLRKELGDLRAELNKFTEPLRTVILAR